ncbi:aldehyde dehydrogenase (NAD+) [Filimonas lacunae]|uniref:Aldehyde dehydrogenase n=1 Tax=Filimonas lacunae TaxID=477680 RepID=A0A173M941_9BACT|nr:aldehyde dehydrogenase family protein [Filimonas lacunae]BAV04043.1 aldehyde dehydrogenase [Filimonas lacunae]SIT16125.1 aldehyde dehydrogenase (NAD+) [Filimonas lacunae]
MNKYQQIFDKQKAYFNTDATKSYEWRIEQLTRMQQMLRDNVQALRNAVGNDFKSSFAEQVFETDAVIGIAEYTKSQLREWMQSTEVPVPRFLAETGHKGIVYREPYGVTLVLGPFNGPLLLLLHPAITAIAAGNPVILTTSNALPESGGLLQKLVPAYFAEESVAVVGGGREAITELLKLPFDFIFFTGSTAVGKIVARAAAENLTPMLLELGGQNPLIVDETADIADAAQKAVWGATAWGGQWCTSPGYAYVHESVAATFIQEARKALREMYGDNPKNSPDYSRIINSKEVRRMAALVDPAKVIAGGQYDEDARYFAPTVVYPVTWEDPIMEEEVFGPILPVLTYTDIQEVIVNIKKRPKPLAAFVFSDDQANIDYLLHTLSFGGGAVNQVNIHLYILSMPFGGVGSSGIGNYYGKSGFESLTHAKSILHGPSGQPIEHLIPPYTQEKVEGLNQWFIY